jgi:hypothetical protein
MLHSVSRFFISLLEVLFRMSDIEFSILFTPPLVITADGDWEKEVFYKEPPFSHKLKREWRSENARDAKRSQEFQTKEWIAYTFKLPEATLSIACKYIAKEILNNENFSLATKLEKASKILIEDSNNNSTVISLLKTDVEKLAENIQEIVRKV